jgi:hypothetical protein
MSTTPSTVRAIVACCLGSLALVACSAGDAPEPAAETAPTTESSSVATTPSPEPSSAQGSKRADALGELAGAAGQHASEMPTLLLIVNETAHRVLLTSADAKSTAAIEPGESLRLASQRVCDWIPLTASISGRVVEEYAEPCHGQTWTITG